jgi:hypothetical protein
MSVVKRSEVNDFFHKYNFVVFHGCWNCSDSVVLCYFSIGTVLTVWYYVIFLLELHTGLVMTVRVHTGLIMTVRVHTGLMIT